jgi:hypothetical protein
MKLIITESQKDKIIEKVIFKYLDKQNYNQLEIKGRIYFVKNVGDKDADIRFDKSTGWCGISYELISFFSRMMSVERFGIKEVIGRWVEHTLQMEVKAPFSPTFPSLFPVEHTLQMEVKATPYVVAIDPLELNIPYNNI